MDSRQANEGLAGLGRVRSSGVLVAADESVRNAGDVERLAAAAAVDVVNLKIMKAGLVAALDAALSAKRLGLGLMIGGMVETRLARSWWFFVRRPRYAAFSRLGSLRRRVRNERTGPDARKHPPRPRRQAPDFGLSARVMLA